MSRQNLSNPSGLIPLLGLVIILVVAIIAAGSIYYVSKSEVANTNSSISVNASNANRNTNDVACTMEAKLCPDGTTVGRVPPSCEFEECSTANTNYLCRLYLPAECANTQGYYYDPESGICSAVTATSGCSKPAFATREACEQECANTHPVFGNANVNTNINGNTNLNTNTGIVVPVDWRTYASSRFGYSIQYPKDWVYDSTSTGLTVFRLDSLGQWQLQVEVTDTSQTLQENADIRNNLYPSWTSNQITLSGQPAIRLEYAGNETDYYGDTVVLLVKDGRLYTISLGVGSDQNEAAMLGTFQLTD